MSSADQSAAWLPPVSRKQLEVIGCKHKYILMSGPRNSTKTTAGMHRIAYDLWNTPHARISIVGRTVTDNFDGGAWQDLVGDNGVLQSHWFPANFGMDWVTPPRMESTHKWFCEVTNRHGGKSRVQLDSCKMENEVERIFKGKRYTTIYITEASNFKQRKTFDVLSEALRKTHREQRLSLIADTNPAEEGDASWLYQLWYTFRALKDFSQFPEEQHAGLRDLQQELKLFEFVLDDNLWMSPSEKAVQKARYAHSPDLYARYVDGRWVRASTNALFAETFRPNFHVIGDTPSVFNENPEVLLPEPTCSSLGTGWDMGDVNNAAVIMEKYYVKDPAYPEGEKSVFKVLDEYVELGRKVTVEEMTEVMVEKMEQWEAICREVCGGAKIRWDHWSDRSAFDKWSNIADLYEYQVVYRCSDGKITLRGAIKKQGTVRKRVDIVRKLLYEERLFISASCTATVEMFQMIQKGKKLAIDKASPYKHIFDALTYFISMECFDELQDALSEKTMPQAGVVTTVPL